MKDRFHKVLYLILIAAAPASTAAVLLWLFSVDGTLGLFQWMGLYRILFYAVGGLGLVAPLLAFAGCRFAIFRRLSIVFAIVGIIIPLAIGGYFLRTSFIFAESTPPLLLMADGTGSSGVPNLALVFRTPHKSIRTLRYGIDSFDQVVTESGPTTNHVLPVTDLLPDSRYQWKLDDGEVCTFTTPPLTTDGNALYHFAVGSDPHFGAGLGDSASGDVAVTSKMLNYIAAPQNRFHAFFITGDLVNMGSSIGDWKAALNTFAPSTCAVPWRPLMGNHDAIINGSPQYVAYLYPNGMATQTGTSTYYRIDSGRVHFILLKMLWGVESFSPQQRQWFERQLQAIPVDDWTIVMLHSMVYASSSEFNGMAWYDPADMVSEVAPLLEQYKVDLVVSGHDHDLEFLQHNGVSYAVVGAMGGKLDPRASHLSPASIWYAPQQYGFLDVRVLPTTMELIFRDPDGQELRSFEIGQNRL